MKSPQPSPVWNLALFRLFEALRPGGASASALTDRQLCDCPSCGRLQLIPPLPPRASAHCRLCGKVLRRTRNDPLRRPLVWALGGLALYGAVITLPFMAIHAWIFGHSATLLHFPAQLNARGFWELAAAFSLFVLVLPPVKLGLLAAVLLGLRLRRPARGLRTLFRWYVRIRPWAMTEVFLVGFFVAYSRLAGLAQINVGPAVWALGGLMLATVAADAMLDEQVVWEAIAKHACLPSAPEFVSTSSAPFGCSICGQLCHLAADGRAHCPRCGVRLWRRKPASIERTWALLIAAVICAVFAYDCPVMTVQHFGRGEPSTIFAGMIELAEIGWWPIAIIVFIASITIPIFKLMALVAMLLSVHRGSTRWLVARTRIFRLVEVIGRWSMIDVFMVSILTVLVQLGFVGSVHPEGGIVAFGAVVILTMHAAFSFDSRLMWDAAARRRAGTTANSGART